jgi:hypothetical protein
MATTPPTVAHPTRTNSPRVLDHQPRSLSHPVPDEDRSLWGSQTHRVS